MAHFGKRARDPSPSLFLFPKQSAQPTFNMRASPARLGGGAQYPYPKEVWSPSGGWWTRPSNWKSNTAVISTGLLFTIYSIWTFSAAREERTVPPTRWIPSMAWSKNAREGGIRDEGYTPSSGGHH